MSGEQRRKYDSDFKRNAVLLAEEPGRSVRDVAESLGINPDLIYQWRKSLREHVKLHFLDTAFLHLQKTKNESENWKRNSGMQKWSVTY